MAYNSGFTTMFTLLELGYIVDKGSASSTDLWKDEAPGKLDITPSVRTRQKSSMGLPVASFSRRTGSGSVTVSGHYPTDFYSDWTAEHGDTGVKAKVATDHKGAVIPAMCLTAKVMDENNNVLYLAFPRTVISNDWTQSVDNTSDDVAEVDMTMTYQPDEHGNGYYKALESDLDETTKSKWMTQFTPSLVRGG